MSEACSACGEVPVREPGAMCQGCGSTILAERDEFAALAKQLAEALEAAQRHLVSVNWANRSNNVSTRARETLEAYRAATAAPHPTPEPSDG